MSPQITTNALALSGRARTASDAGDDGDQVVGVNGLGDVDLVSGKEGHANVRFMREGGEGDGGKILCGAAGFSDKADQVVAILEGHGDVADEDLGLDAVDALEGFHDRAGGGDRSAHVAEDLDEKIAGVGFVIDDEQAKAVEPRKLGGCGGELIGRGRVKANGAQGKSNGEERAFTGTAAHRRDLAAVEFDEGFGDREAQAEAAELAFGAAFALAEAVEDVGEEVGGNSPAVVADLDAGGGTIAQELDADRAVLRRKFDGVGEEVPDGLADAVGVAGDVADR